MSQKERIIEQAMQMFVTQGIKAVRMDDIARQLGVSKRTLYELFGDKDELLYQSMNLYFDQNEEQHNELTVHAENVLHALFMVLTHVKDNSEVTNRLFANLQKFYPAIYDRLVTEGTEKHRESMRQCLEQGVEEGLFLPEQNIELSISILYHIALALFTRRGGVTIPGEMSEHDAHLQVATTFFRGISTRKGIELIDNYMAAHQAQSKTNDKV